ncbi:PP2C family protein-serine/threonine phosphatase [Piscinibacter sakaiensis]|uniref:PPM-type phosphatase domain-containing protein n=1 Tax=Piscinibacter sakaiensis TaxID=1547922 RepID=A0A0K8P202_PISS1|nr:protein phosphatase 2C domain-containing protein [Piscinibacter sakaiensis]GAP36692.1 hypothetical protein ISF6_2532 [Piscinibacter sakaiensis]
MSASTAMILPGNAQSIGRRSEQQDAFAFSDLSDEDFCRHGGAVCVMCDGMGGHAAGGEAARAAVGAFMASYRRSGPGLGIADRLTQALHEANQAVLQVARQSGAGDSGATLVAAVLHPDGLRWISVGDSRLMLLRGGRLHRINQEHRYRGDLLRRSADDGIDWEDAQADPMGEHLTSSLGEEPLSGVDRSLRPLPLQPGDQVYLATDGLYRVVDDSALLEAAWPAGAARPGPPEAVCAAWLALVQAADRPDQDNVSIAGLAWPGEEAFAAGAGAAADPRLRAAGEGPLPGEGVVAGGATGTRSWGPSVPPEDWSALPPTVPLTVPPPPLPPAAAPDAPAAARRGGRLPSGIALAVAATVGALATWGALSPSPSAAPGATPPAHDALPGLPAASAAAANGPGPAASAGTPGAPADTAAAAAAAAAVARPGAAASAGDPGAPPTGAAATPGASAPAAAANPASAAAPAPAAAPDAPPPATARADRRNAGAAAPGLAAPPVPGRPGEAERPTLGAPPGSTRGSTAPEADGLAAPPRGAQGGLPGGLQSGGPLPPPTPTGPAAAPRPGTP